MIVSTRNSEFRKFIEVKYHKKSSGRIGIGQKDGNGFQPEILKIQSSYFENNLLWILGSEDKPGKRWSLKNSQIREFISGGALIRKYNNLEKKLFREIKPQTDEEMITELENWLDVGQQ